MVFSSPLFLLLFLPLVLAAYFLSPRYLKNGLLLAVSLLFYAWGDVSMAALLAASITVNYALGLRIDRAESRHSARFYIVAGMFFNLGLLGYFKYANFFLDNLNWLLVESSLPSIRFDRIGLPLGISFFTFQALSYLIDVYRGQEQGQASFTKLALYISMFPQLVAGPIVRYGQISKQLESRSTTIDGVAAGMSRFVTGLAKKVLIANQVGLTADIVFELPPAELVLPVAWLGIVCYTLQIYFDFSGYSDMAIGLGAMFGFRFPENFRYPYTARSVTEFWQRWHISLSTWFRDYLYIPLGGNRVSPLRVYRNLLLVFVLCGFWHGASWNFVVWGLLHGGILIGERRWFARHSRLPFGWANHLYVLLLVMITWAIFRAENLPHALQFLAALAGANGVSTAQTHLGMYLSQGLVLTIAVGAVGACPMVPALRELQQRAAGRLADSKLALPWHAGVELLRTAGTVALLSASIVFMSAATHQPFIYFRF